MFLLPLKTSLSIFCISLATSFVISFLTSVKFMSMFSEFSLISSSFVNSLPHEGHRTSSTVSSEPCIISRSLFPQVGHNKVTFLFRRLFEHTTMISGKKRAISWNEIAHYVSTLYEIIKAPSCQGKNK